MRAHCDCAACPLPGNLPVCGEGPLSNPLALLVGEAPGADEETYGRPFVGKSGQELTMYLSRFARVSRERIRIENIVRCRPPNNRDPHSAEVECCTSRYLVPSLEAAAPDIVVTVGRVATQWFLGSGAKMERVHGIPQQGEGRVVVPVYHPAYGLHSPRQMKQVMEDFTVVGRVVRGQQGVHTASEIELDYRLEEG